MGKGNYDDPRYAAQDFLSRRDHSEAEMRQKLSRKKFSPEDIDSTIKWLYQQRLLDDRLFAKRYVESALRAKPVGPRYISSKLRVKGVGSDIIAETISRMFSSKREIKLAREAVTAWRRLHPKYAADTVRLQRFLASRGFSQDVVYEVLDSGFTQRSDPE